MYDIVRFFRDPDKSEQVILDSVTLEEAQEHCNREDTHGDGWFDGYRKIEDEEEPWMDLKHDPYYDNGHWR